VPIRTANPLKGAIPPGPVDTDGSHLDAMGTRIANNLCRCVETHRLRIDQSGTEGLRIMAFDIHHAAPQPILVRHVRASTNDAPFSEALQ